MFAVRDNEPDYAFLRKDLAPEKNQHGAAIDLIGAQHELAGKSLNINCDSAVGSNPDRYKQHGFHFSTDDCIGCHACEAACSEKNDLPAHISFRSVGYVEGGTWPDYQRMNISMACNHCDDPVCLKGCPTRAYTKFAEYGAVLQDPDICFGCGYCTWVCPYNAPQLDHVKGEVSKCNMCVDRLEVGLKPACVSACLAGALDFGVIETLPENRQQAKLSIPGFPTPEITRPNIRFQQLKSLPREMNRTDSMPIQYIREGDKEFKSRPKEKTQPMEWSWAKLRSREDPLVVFTLVSQAVVGAFLILFLGKVFGLDGLAQFPKVTIALLFGLLALETFALALSTAHLGKPRYFYRAFYNLRYSPVSREVAALALFYNALGAYALLSVVSLWFSTGWLSLLQTISGWCATGFGPLALYAMYKIYRIKARPFWNHWQVLSSFFGTAASLGTSVVGLVYLTTLSFQGLSDSKTMSILAALLVAGLAIEAIGLVFHARDLKRRGGEAAASHLEQCSTFGKTYLLRNLGLGAGIVVASAQVIIGPSGIPGLFSWLVLTGLVAATAVIGRALFYVLVIPTTMPGAFFWRNKGFEEHARATGLAKMPQVGVLPDAH
jgi:DMSO reductase iron-sulfur subunit